MHLKVNMAANLRRVAVCGRVFPRFYLQNMTSFSSKQQLRLKTDAIIAAKEPAKVELVNRKRYSWCACGRSKKQPFCDGSHRGTGMSPVRFVAEESCETFLCMCKQTGTRPYCDGTHATELVQNA